MKRLKLVSSMITVLCLVWLIGVTQATTYAVGVKPGDYIKYNVSVSYGQYSFQASIKITITNVAGTEITGIMEESISGQSSTNQTFLVDIVTGGGSISGFIIPANLTVGQNIPGETAPVQDVTDRNGRKAVFANASSPYLGLSGQVYWDQATGVLMEVNSQIAGSSVSMNVAETNLWSVGLGSFAGLAWWIWLIIVIAIVGGFAGTILALRRRKPPVTPPETLPPPPPPLP